MLELTMIITLDGPTASGKSSIARALAQKFGGIHFNSGLIYRCIGHVAAREHGYTKEMVHTVSHALVCSTMPRMVYGYTDRACILFDGVDVTHELKTAHVDALASCVSELAHVRDVVNEYARALTQNSVGIESKYRAMVADGRDCGTVMFPHAQYKFFITASPEVRARRWHADQKKQGKEYSFEHALALVNERDARDMQRTVAPLEQAPEAIVIDTSNTILDDVLEIIDKKIWSQNPVTILKK